MKEVQGKFGGNFMEIMVKFLDIRFANFIQRMSYFFVFTL